MRRFGAVLALALMSASASGCWLQPRFDAARSGWNAGEEEISEATVDDLVELWATTVPGGGPVEAPLVNGARAYVVSGTEATAIDVTTGAVRWSTTVNPDGLPTANLGTGDPLYADDTLIVPWASTLRSEGGGRVRLDPATGDLVGEIEGIPALGIEDAVAGGTPALSMSIGVPGNVVTSIAWNRSPMPAVSSSSSATGPGQFAIVTDIVAWSSGTQAQGFTPTCQAPNPDFPQFCVPDWTIELGGRVRGVAGLGDDQVIYVDDTGTVHMLDVALGTPQWTAEAGAPILGPPAVAGANIFVTTTDGRLVAIHVTSCGAATCRQDWEAPLGGTPTGAPVAANDVVFVPVGNRIVAVGRECRMLTCTPLATFEVGEPITGGPVVDGGRLVVGTQSGRVVAFGLPG